MPSSLSNILNPAPPPNTTPHSASALSTGNMNRQVPPPAIMTSPASQHRRRESVSSPGLDVLADAASHTAPLASPTMNNTAAFRRPSSGAQGIYSPGLAQLSEAVKISEGPQVFGGVLAGMNTQRTEERVDGGNVMRDVEMRDVETKREGNDAAAATTQIRAPLPGPEQDLPSLVIPEAQSEQVKVKTEMNDTPVQQHAPAVNGIAHADASPLPSSPAASTTAKDTLKPKAPPTKKRAAPKKGTASSIRPPASKKRKLDSSGEAHSADASPSRGTPSTARASATPVPARSHHKAKQPTSRSSSAVPADDASAASSDTDEENKELFCICRKPDDHSVMIGCDGPCEDWFHLKCVAMTESKTALVQKWFCPNCAEKGFETLWKRMCRLPGCEKPARHDEKKGGTGIVSKYCGEEHGVEFLRRLVDPEGAVKNEGGIVGDVKNAVIGAATRGRRGGGDSDFSEADIQAAIAASESMNGVSTKPSGHEISDEQDPTTLHGGVLNPPVLKTLVDTVKDVDEFHRLGSPAADPANTTNTTSPEINYTPTDLTALSTISQKRSTLIHRRDMLVARDRFVDMVEARHRAVLAEVKEHDKNVKEMCGYDARLTWSDGQFDAWRLSDHGKAVLEKGVLDPPDDDGSKAEASVNGTLPNGVPNGLPNGIHHDDDDDPEPTSSPPPPSPDHTSNDEIGRGVCKKRRCERHRAWYKGQQTDNGFEKDLVRQALRKLELEEKEIRQRALVRGLEGGEK